jgi:hypothetical protein
MTATPLFGNALVEFLQCHPEFKAGQVGAQAPVRAGRENGVRVVRAPEVDGQQLSAGQPVPLWAGAPPLRAGSPDMPRGSDRWRVLQRWWRPEQHARC